MNLFEFKKRVKRWEDYYRMKGIPLKKVEMVFTMCEPDRDDLVMINDENINHGHYEPRNDDEEIVGGFRGKLYFISLNQFNSANGMEK